jgi:hypothetical protein
VDPTSSVAAGFAGALLQRLGRQLSEAWHPRQRPRSPRNTRTWRCACGRPVFFGQNRCRECDRELGYDPLAGEMQALEAVPAADVRPHWRCASGARPGQHWVRCANADGPAACNWLLPADEPGSRGQRPLLCRSCRLNRTIPDLAWADNAQAWARIETAKRRLVSQLLALGLPLATRVAGAGGPGSENTQRGLAFDFLRELPGGPPVLTGHAAGLITLDIEEADDAVRERLRSQLGEPYRTLLGHLRHEVGHYCWDRLIAGSSWLEPFRQLFGDERADYQAALQRHYQQGPPADWPATHVSAYAASHPWEDWAESWAHYLHLLDTLDTALSFGLEADDVEVDVRPYGRDALTADDPDFLALVNAWLELTALLNELSRSMGQPDFYPFVLSAAAVRKLHFVHRVVTDSSRLR